MTAARRTSHGRPSRDFWLYWSAGTSDALGTQASGLVLPLLLLGLGSTVVAPVHYPRAVARLEAGEQGALVAGPALGGVLFPLARWLPLLVDALSYVFSALCVRAVRADLNPHGNSRSAPPHLMAELRSGIRFVREETFLRLVLLWTAGVNGLLTALYYGAVFSIRGHGAGTASTWLVLALSGAAGLVGAAAAPRLARRIPAARIVVAASWTMVPVAAGRWSG